MSRFVRPALRREPFYRGAPIAGGLVLLILGLPNVRRLPLSAAEVSALVGIGQGARGETFPGLYAVAMRAGAPLVDDGLLFRSLSVVAVVIAVAVTIALARIVTQRPVSPYALALFAVCPLIVAVAQEADPVALLFLLASVSTYLAARIEASKPGALHLVIAWLGIGALGVATHAIFIGLVIAQSPVILRRERTTSAATVAALALAVICVVALAAVLKPLPRASTIGELFMGLGGSSFGVTPSFVLRVSAAAAWVGAIVFFAVLGSTALKRSSMIMVSAWVPATAAAASVIALPDVAAPCVAIALPALLALASRGVLASEDAGMLGRKRLVTSLGIGALLLASTGIAAGSSARLGCWNGGFENGGEWAAYQGALGSFSLVTDPVRQGSFAGGYTLHPGDRVADGQRAEWIRSGSYGEGDEVWLEWSLYLPSSEFRIVSGSYVIFTQWHDTEPASGSPPVLAVVENDHGRNYVTLRVRGGNQATAVGRSWRLAEAPMDSWIDLKMHVRWSPVDAGLLEFWMDDELEFSQSTPTIFFGKRVYLKQGNYRSPADVVSTLYEDGTVVAEDEDDLRCP